MHNLVMHVINGGLQTLLPILPQARFPNNIFSFNITGVRKSLRSSRKEYILPYLWLNPPGITGLPIFYVPVTHKLLQNDSLTF